MTAMKKKPNKTHCELLLSTFTFTIINIFYFKYCPHKQELAGFFHFILFYLILYVRKKKKKKKI